MEALPCPSFNAYASSDVADKVTRETRDDYGFLEPSMSPLGNYGDEEFEFVTLHERDDEVYLDSRVGPVYYPIFNREVLKENQRYEKNQKIESAISENHEEAGMPLQTSLRNLFIDDEDRRRENIDPPSSSSSEASDLDSIPPDSYCVWTPNSAKASPNRCKKSNSTGSSSSSSKRWKLLDLLCRSNSDGKDRFVCLTPSPAMKKKAEKSEISKEDWSSTSGSGNLPNGNKVAKSPKAKITSSTAATSRSQSKASAHEIFYVRYRASKEVDRRRSYLPYRPDLVGFGANLGGFGTKTLPPF